MLELELSDTIKSDDDYIDAVSKMITMVSKKETKNILIDRRELSYIANESVHNWISTYVIPFLEASGIKKIGFCVNKNHILKTTKKSNHSLSIHVSSDIEKLRELLKK